MKRLTISTLKNLSARQNVCFIGGFRGVESRWWSKYISERRSMILASTSKGAPFQVFHIINSEESQKGESSMGDYRVAQNSSDSPNSCMQFVQGLMIWFCLKLVLLYKGTFILLFWRGNDYFWLFYFWLCYSEDYLTSKADYFTGPFLASSPRLFWGVTSVSPYLSVTCGDIII